MAREPHTQASALLPPARLVTAARGLAGLSQRELADAAGVSLSALNRFEAGSATMRTDSLSAVAAVLRRHRIRFVGETRDAEMGLMLLKPDPQRDGTDGASTGGVSGTSRAPKL